MEVKFTETLVQHAARLHYGERQVKLRRRALVVRKTAELQGETLSAADVIERGGGHTNMTWVVADLSLTDLESELGVYWDGDQYRPA